MVCGNSSRVQPVISGTTQDLNPEPRAFAARRQNPYVQCHACASTRYAYTRGRHVVLGHALCVPNDQPSFTVQNKSICRSAAAMEIPGLPNAPRELLTAGAGLLVLALIFALGPGVAVGGALCDAFIGKVHCPLECYHPRS